ncbi:MAG: hypothetical protein Q4A28_08065 [Brachymonas sp.]|nr:hypothetical protein [Brachymonas sp.]
MTYTSDKILTQEYVKWISNEFSEHPCIAGTVNFQKKFNGEQLTEKTAKKTLKHYRNSLSRKVYGNKARACRGGRCIKFAPAWEGGVYDLSVGLHAHLVIPVPYGWDKDDWLATCRGTWLDLPWADKVNYDFKHMVNDGWISYTLKHRTKRNPSEALDLELLSL